MHTNRMWHSPQKLCFYNSSNNKSINNSIDRIKKFWQNTECKKIPSSFTILLPSSDSIPVASPIPINSTYLHEYICISSTDNSSSRGSNQLNFNFNINSTSIQHSRSASQPVSCPIQLQSQKLTFRLSTSGFQSL